MSKMTQRIKRFNSWPKGLEREKALKRAPSCPSIILECGKGNILDPIPPLPPHAPKAPHPAAPFVLHKAASHPLLKDLVSSRRVLPGMKDAATQTSRVAEVRSRRPWWRRLLCFC